jgi:hypothetical protein
VRRDVTRQIAAEPGRGLERAWLDPNKIEAANPARGAGADAQEIPIGAPPRAASGAGAKERDSLRIAEQIVEAEALTGERSTKS